MNENCQTVNNVKEKLIAILKWLAEEADEIIFWMQDVLETRENVSTVPEVNVMQAISINEDYKSIHVIIVDNIVAADLR